MKNPLKYLNETTADVIHSFEIIPRIFFRRSELVQVKCAKNDIPKLCLQRKSHNCKGQIFLVFGIGNFCFKF